MAKAYVFLADGFEEIEGLTAVDILRRGGVDVTTVSVTGRREVAGGHKIPVLADALLEELQDEADLYVLPGGMPGTLHLKEHEGLGELLRKAKADGRKLAAICAAPQVLGSLGLLQDEKAVCYPGVEPLLTGAEVGTEAVAVSGQITTSRGVGTAIAFALSLLAQLTDQETADRIAASILYNRT